MFCTECGTELKENQKFCTNCGSSVEVRKTATAAPSPILGASSVTVSRQPASRSSSAPAVEAASTPGSVAPVKLAGPVAVPTVTPPRIAGGATEPAKTAAPRRGISPLLLWAGVGGLAVVAVVTVLLFVHFRNQPPRVSDVEIEKSVQAKFSADPDISKCTVVVRSQNGVVTLTGLVNKTSDRSTADGIARQQPGVRTVVDNLVLATEGPGTGTQSVSVKTAIVRGNQPWTSSGVLLDAGAVVAIAASGGVSMGAGWPLMSPAGKQPNCDGRTGFPAPHLPCWSLIGRIGPDGTIFYVGSGTTLRAPRRGELLLGVNDDQVGDNSGSWTATVRVLSGTAQDVSGNQGTPGSSGSSNGTFRTLSLFDPIVDPSTKTVVVNGVDTARPTTPFRFDWGDGTVTDGFFPQTKTYREGGRAYRISVIATYKDGSHGYANTIAQVPYSPPNANAGVTWLGFANGNVAQDRDAELRRNCGGFKRVYVPDNAGNKFTDLCGYVSKTCEKVCDWQGGILPCDAVSQGGNRDGTRVVFCR
jgi:hypothetical protein